MDINSLLSPSDTPKTESAPSVASPHLSPTKGTAVGRPGVANRKSSGLNQQRTPEDIASAHSPSPNTQYFPRISQISHSTPNQQPLRSPHAQSNSPLQAQPQTQTASFAYAAQQPTELARIGQSTLARQSLAGSSTPGSATGTPDIGSPLLQHGQAATSTPQMDTLADLAAMQQQHQQHHHNHRPQSTHASPAVGPAEIRAAKLATTRPYSPAPGRPLVSRNPTDGSLVGVQTPPRTFSAQCLSKEDLDELNQTAATLHGSALNYQAHIRMINLLHKGLLNHVDSLNGVQRDGREYELLADLRKAREVMRSIYPLGEDLWHEWIDDEKALTGSIEDRIGVMNLCAQGVTDEPSSAKLWRQYGDYMYRLYAAANGFAADEEAWSEEDRIICQEVFTWTSVNNIWEQGVLATQWRMNDSDSVWDRYMEILLSEQKRKGKEAPFSIEQLQQLFVERLTQPHATWDKTFQNFSMFVSEQASEEMYEEIMSKAASRAAQAKQMWSLREMFELKIAQAERTGNKDTEWEGYSEYLKWEVEKKGVFSSHLIVALYERAVTRFSAEATLWEDFIEYLIQDKPANVDTLRVLERATSHCPWSGSLWSHRLAALEAAGKNFGEMEQVKHKATQTGILELAGVEELLKVYIAWCGFLRRRAFQDEHNNEDDHDIAEVGICSALEHVREVGERLYGKDQWPGDPLYRLERIHIKFVTHQGNPEAARKIWQSIVPYHSSDYNFWYRYYIWEMIMWANFAIRKTDPLDFSLRNPTEATAILKQALQYIETMDFPEQLVQMFLAHCEQHESVTELQNAFIVTRRLNKQIYARRSQEHQVQLAQQKLQYEQQSLMNVAQETTAVDASLASDVPMADAAAALPSHGKRKAEVEDSAVSKKQKTQDAVPDQVAVTQPQRDREHTTVLVKKLPRDASQTAIRKFFRDSGKVINIKIHDESDESKTATVEFETAEEAQYALTRSTKPFDGQEIEITYACGSTLWVSNYPPEADQKYIRGLFEKYGEVVDVRFPSLKFNTHRRFCYVQFATPSEALAATALDGTALESSNTDAKDKYHLVAKVSAPEKRTDREGALEEGREVFVGQLSWFASEAELREFFSECGSVERVRIPKNIAGKSKGHAFVTYTTPEEAQAAVSKLQGQEIRGRAITLEVAKPNASGPKRVATTVLAERGRSHTPGANGDSHMNGNAASPTASHASDGAAATSTATGENRKERTLFIVNIPDTVNDTRIRTFLGQYGALRKLILRPDHQGAIAEFATVADAGRAEMKIPDANFDFEEGTDRFVKVVDEREFFQTQGDFHSDKLGKAPKPANGSAAAKKLIAAPRISRPAQAGGRRGGLGIKRGGAGLSAPRVASDGHDGQAGSLSIKPAGDEKHSKSNNDFRVMLAEGKK